MITSRRGFLSGVGALLAAPAIVRVSALMPISTPKLLDDFTTDNLRYRATERFRAGWMNSAQFRELLLPGLRDAFEGQYEMLAAPYGTAGQRPHLSRSLPAAG